MNFFIMISISTVMLILDFIIGNFGLRLGLCMFALTYFYLTSSKSLALILAFIIGIIVDAVYARNLLGDSFFLIISMIFAGYICKDNKTRQIIDAFLPGMAMGGTYFLLATLYPILLSETVTLGDFLSFFIFGIAWGGFIFPVFVFVLDFLSTILGIKRFCYYDSNFI